VSANSRGVTAGSPQAPAGAAPTAAPPGRTKLVALAIAALALTVAPTLLRGLFGEPGALQTYGHVPAFHLVNERGAPVDERSLQGHVTVVDFIFTRCPSSCPRLTARMGELQGRLAQSKSGVKLVSISVDPDNDTPPVLAAYAAQAHADPSRWSFLTGATKDVQDVVVSGFRVAASKQARGANDYDVIHGDWFVLVDPRGDIRGYFTTTEPKDLDAIVKAIDKV
jgi:protein SCO1/2